jgi:hypothetical protein
MESRETSQGPSQGIRKDSDKRGWEKGELWVATKHTALDPLGDLHWDA